MKITLPPEQKRWLEARVADGAFESPEAAILQFIADRMALASEVIPFKPDVDEVRIPHRDVLSVEEAIADVDAHMASLKR